MLIWRSEKQRLTKGVCSVVDVKSPRARSLVTELPVPVPESHMTDMSTDFRILPTVITTLFKP